MNYRYIVKMSKNTKNDVFWGFPPYQRLNRVPGRAETRPGGRPSAGGVPGPPRGGVPPPGGGGTPPPPGGVPPRGGVPPGYEVPQNPIYT